LHKQSVAQKVIVLVREVRMIMPRLGGRKLYYMLKDELLLLKVGRDKLFRILRAIHMLTTIQMHEQNKLRRKQCKIKKLNNDVIVQL
jgi:hypothetical protein